MTTLQIRPRRKRPNAGGGGGTTPNYAALTVADAQQPDYAAYTALGVRTAAAGTAYADPVSGLTIVKTTSATVPFANSGGGVDYSSVASISHLWVNAGSNFVTVHQIFAFDGQRWLYDINLATGALSNRRQAPGAGSRDLQLAFSQNPATPRICYYIKSGANGLTILQRYNTATDTDAATGNFPHDFGPTDATADLNWLVGDRNDQWFSFGALGNGFVLAWDSANNVVKKKTVAQIATLYSPSGATIDEPHLDLDGEYVYIAAPKAGSNNLVVWKLSDDTLTDTGVLYSHLAGYRNMVVYSNGGSAQERRPPTGSPTQYLTTIQSTDGDQHRSENYIQDGGNDDWIEIDCILDGFLDDPTPAWTLHSGTAGVDAVWKFTPVYRGGNSTRMGAYGAITQQETADATRLRGQLTRVGSVGAVNAAGKMFHDAGPNVTYARALDDLDLSVGANANRMYASCPNSVHQAIAVMKLDGSSVRFVAHHYTLDNSYYHQPKACISNGGHCITFDSDMNDSDGRYDNFVVLLPVS
jgi:hypothetical protein